MIPADMSWPVDPLPIRWRDLTPAMRLRSRILMAERLNERELRLSVEDARALLEKAEQAPAYTKEK